MSIFQLVGIGLGGAVTAMLVKQINPGFALYVSVITSVILTYFALQYFSPVLSYASEISQKNNLGDYAAIILRVTAIGVITRLACELCSAAGENAISTKLELVGKGAIAITVLPVLKGLVDAVQEFLL